MKKVVVLTGSGISAESGLSTFRGAGGLWEGHKVTEVATPQAFASNQEFVLRFYNERHRQLAKARPNAGHLALVEMEQDFDVSVITQNVDDLHEKAGSSHILHLHGELTKKRSSWDERLIVDWPPEEEIRLGDLAPDGGQWRPHIVWFREDVTLMPVAAELCGMADIFVIIGTSLVVYPAAGLVDYVPPHAAIYVVDPELPAGLMDKGRVHFLKEPATSGVPRLLNLFASFPE